MWGEVTATATTTTTTRFGAWRARRGNVKFDDLIIGTAISGPFSVGTHMNFQVPTG